MPPLLEVRNLDVRFPSRNGALHAVRDVSFHVDAGETLGLVGESGSGKSVTSLAILRLLAPGAEVRGQIRFDGQSLLELPMESASGKNMGNKDMDFKDMRSLRGARIAMIFQEPMTALNPVMRIGEQIAEAVRAHHKVAKLEAWARAVEGLREVALPEAEHRARDYPHQLSGGMRQRVMIAMALVNRPQLLIADEPTTALDVTVQAQILELLAELRAKYKLAMLFISHDLAVVSGVADRVAIMYAGQIVESAAARTIFKHPLHPYTQGLLRSVPTLRTPRDQKLAAIEGAVPPITSLPPGCAFEPRCGLRIDQCRATPPELIEVAPGHALRCPVAAESVPKTAPPVRG